MDGKRGGRRLSEGKEKGKEGGREIRKGGMQRKILWIATTESKWCLLFSDLSLSLGKMKMIYTLLCRKPLKRSSYHKADDEVLTMQRGIFQV